MGRIISLHYIILLKLFVLNFTNRPKKIQLFTLHFGNPKNRVAHSTIYRMVFAGRFPIPYGNMVLESYGRVNHNQIILRLA